jgi:hypothetical protein
VDIVINGSAYDDKRLSAARLRLMTFWSSGVAVATPENLSALSGQLTRHLSWQLPIFMRCKVFILGEATTDVFERRAYRNFKLRFQCPINAFGSTGQRNTFCFSSKPRRWCIDRLNLPQIM